MGKRILESPTERQDYAETKRLLGLAGYHAIKLEPMFAPGRQSGEDGMADWIVLLPKGRTVFVEQKNRDLVAEKSLQKNQRLWRSMVERLGHTVIVENSPAAVLRAVQEYANGNTDDNPRIGDSREEDPDLHPAGQRDVAGKTHGGSATSTVSRRPYANHGVLGSLGGRQHANSRGKGRGGRRAG